MVIYLNIELQPIESSCSMPHHCHVNKEKETTKLRVVTLTDVYLNDLQMVEPIIHDDCFATILRFRKCWFLLSAVIQKMCRRVFMNPNEFFKNIVERL